MAAITYGLHIETDTGHCAKLEGDEKAVDALIELLEVAKVPFDERRECWILPTKSEGGADGR